MSNAQRNLGFFGDNASTDAFGRLRISDPFVLYDHQFQYGKGELFWNEKITGGATSTHLASESSVELAVTSTNDEIIRQSKKYVRYVPGKSQLIFFTFVLGSSDDGVRKRAGYFDDNNGVYLENIGNSLKWVVRSKTGVSVSVNEANQTDWNIERYNDIDITKAQIAIIDIEWLGVGRVRVGFVVDGKIIYVHEFLHANNLDKVYMTTANLPIRYEIKRISGTGVATFKQICCSVSSEGGYEKRGLSFSASNGASGYTLSSRRPILSIRPKTTFNSIENRILVEPKNIELLATTNPIFYEVIYNGTLSGGSFSGVSSNSCVEYDVYATGITGGTVIRTGYVGAGVGQSSQVQTPDLLNKFVLALDITATSQDTLTIVATNIGNNPVAYGNITWLESQD
jgi:hypothetical protein